MSKDGSERGADETAWIHRQNIARYRALLANPGRADDHDQIRKLLFEAEEKLRVLDAD
ncbi:hypothetical protein [Sphingomonas abietis]|uniref:Uncharacterized protein n=1 Tax=Sphingomonas abietis TaxID=3012344 RepID=A0ABY7NGM7_9SPHN|nr:hypothetical protein [Sphingomonas abietis]WBO20678.1 hypothetical protein PBT88_10650 [Sphingomonas abietis]